MGEGPTTAWFHCFCGIAGDMALGALLDAGADVDEVRSLLDRLPVSGFALEARDGLRGGIGATDVRVRVEDSTVVRTAAHITGLVTEARLPERVRRRALATFDALAAAEGRLHRRPPEQVHFHEVGGLDALVDVVGTMAALEVLGVDEVLASPVATGLGTVRAAHGVLPNPAPATVELLKGVPSYGLDLNVELTTPTGAAILAGVATGFGPMPPMDVESVGYGAGDAELEDRPNLLQVVLGSRDASLERGQDVVLLEANVDDATGETLAHTVSELLVAGAHDAWISPIVMKKGRPAHTVHALADPALAGQVAGVLTRETGSLGVRGSHLERWPQDRRVEHVHVEGLPVRVKVSPGRVKVEHDDAVRVARHTGRPVREVVSLAEESWRRRGEGPHRVGEGEPSPGAEGGDPEPGPGGPPGGQPA